MWSNIKRVFSRKKRRKILFYRNFKGFQGGHLKTFNYFQYLKDIPDFYPSIYFSESSTWNENPWKNNCDPEARWDPHTADILFLAGLDWGALDPKYLNPNQPVINLIQGMRHADPNDIRYTYLTNKAIRICVSSEISNALKDTKIVSGPIYTIPNGIDLNYISSLVSNPDTTNRADVVISGLKQKVMAKTLEKKLIAKNISVECILEQTPRSDYLKKLQQAKVSLLLPLKSEGFYLPALESMALGSLTICPDCIGNRGFCFKEINCLMPKYDVESIIDEVVYALNLPLDDAKKIIDSGLRTATEHNAIKEKESFKKIMEDIDSIWFENEN